MSNETKLEVFEVAMNHAAKSGWVDYSEMMNRYDTALPDNLPVIPKEVGEYLKRYKLMFTLFGFLRDAVSRIDTPLDALNQTKYHWIANNQNTFARAWLLGVWRVEETGEIVKL